MEQDPESTAPIPQLLGTFQSFSGRSGGRRALYWPDVQLPPAPSIASLPPASGAPETFEERAHSTRRQGGRWIHKHSKLGIAGSRGEWGGANDTCNSVFTKTCLHQGSLQSLFKLVLQVSAFDPCRCPSVGVAQLKAKNCGNTWSSGVSGGRRACQVWEQVSLWVSPSVAQAGLTQFKRRSSTFGG